MWNRYLMSAFVSVKIQSNSISNIEQRRSYTALCDDLVLLFATTLSNICRSKYEPTVEAIERQLLSCNTVNISLDGSTFSNKKP